jgi:hypothetical protein
VNPRPCRQEGSNLYVLLNLVRVCVPLRKSGGSDSLKCEYFSPSLFLVLEHVTSIVGGCVDLTDPVGFGRYLSAMDPLGSNILTSMFVCLTCWSLPLLFIGDG